MRQLALAAMLLLAACQTQRGEGTEAVETPIDLLSHPLGAGAGFYEHYCAQCHGLRGRAQDGVTVDLGAYPVDLSQLTARNGGLFPVRRVMGQIYGYEGKFQPDAFHRGLRVELGPLLEGELVEWIAPDGSVEITPRGMFQLLRHIESFQIDPIGPR